MCKETVNICAQEKILRWLDEALEEYRCYKSDFLLGKVYAYVDCVEIILYSEGVDDDALLAFEEHCGIR